jgi:hypothetical protein
MPFNENCSNRFMHVLIKNKRTMRQLTTKYQILTLVHAFPCRDKPQLVFHRCDEFFVCFLVRSILQSQGT